ncbi:MAG: YcxB family protein [Pseudomonadota bacterium]
MTDAAPQNDQSFSTTFRWSEALVEEKDRYFSLADVDEADGKLGLPVAVVLGILAVAAAGLWLIEAADTAPRRATLFFILGAAAGSTLACYVMWRFMQWTERRLLDAMFDAKQQLLDSPPSRLSFGPDGFTEVDGDATHHLGWSRIKEIREFQGGIVLVTGPKTGIFITDISLPNGIDRTEAIRRFKRWKGPW